MIVGSPQDSLEDRGTGDTIGLEGLRYRELFHLSDTINSGLYCVKKKFRQPGHFFLDKESEGPHNGFSERRHWMKQIIQLEYKDLRSLMRGGLITIAIGDKEIYLGAERSKRARTIRNVRERGVGVRTRRVHKKTNLGFKKIPCPICGEKYLRFGMAAHVRKVHKKRYTSDMKPKRRGRQ